MNIFDILFSVLFLICMVLLAIITIPIILIDYILVKIGVKKNELFNNI